MKIIIFLGYLVLAVCLGLTVASDYNLSQKLILSTSIIGGISIIYVMGQFGQEN